MKQQGRLFVFEGPDSVGKTTLATRLWASLNTPTTPCDLLSFPGKEDGTIGKFVYDIHHKSSKFEIQSISPMALQTLHIAAHLDIIERKILPGLAQGRTIILDRFWFSTYVYGKMAGLPDDLINSIIAPELQLWGSISPSAIFLLKRYQPLEFRISTEWEYCAYLYEQMAEKLKDSYTVHFISNENEIDFSLFKIINLIS